MASAASGRADRCPVRFWRLRLDLVAFAASGRELLSSLTPRARFGQTASQVAMVGSVRAAPGETQWRPLDWVTGYRREWLRPDVVAGLSRRRSSFRRPWPTRRLPACRSQVGPLHGLRADGHLRPARHLARAQREHDDDDRASWRARSSPSSRPMATPPRCCAASATLTLLVGCLLALAARAAPRLRRQLHLRAGADRLQGRDRARHRGRPGAEAARRAFPQGDVRRRTCVALVHSLPHTSAVDARRRRGDDRVAGRPQALPAPAAGAAGGRRGGHRGDGAAGPRGLRRRDRRRDSARPAGAHAAGLSDGGAAVARPRSASRS